MTWQRSVQAAIRALKRKEISLQKQLEQVRTKIDELQDVASSQSGAGGRARSGSRRLSPQGRAAISRAAKKRWADYRKQKGRPRKR
jgi:hypothetical protein